MTPDFSKLYKEGKYNKIREIIGENPSDEEKYWLLSVLFRLEQIDEGLELIEKWNNQIKEQPWRARIIFRSSGFYNWTQQVDKSMELMKEALNELQAIGDNKFISLANNNLGYYAYQDGKYELALERFDKSNEYHQKFDGQDNLFSLYNMIAIYRLQGRIDKSRETVEKALELVKQEEDTLINAMIMTQTAWFHQSTGNVKQARHYFQRALDLYRPINAYNLIHEPLIGMLKVLLDFGEQDQARKIVEEIKSMHENTTSPKVELYYMYARAIYLKSIPRAKPQVQAAALLYEIVQDYDLEKIYTLKAMVNLVELLLRELSVYDTGRILDEIEQLTSRMYKIAQSEKLFPMIIEVLVLKSRLEVLDGKMQEAQKLINQALVFASDRDLTELGVKVKKEEKKMKQEFKSLTEFIDSNSTYHQRLEKSNIFQYIDEMQQIAGKG